MLQYNSLTKNSVIACSVLVVALVLSVSLVAAAEESGMTSPDSAVTNPASVIQYPVAELGNCGSKNDCRSYCNNPENMEACSAFAKVRGLVKNEVMENVRRFSAALRDSSGPGGCNTVGECIQYCSVSANLEACVAFAEDHELEGEKLKTARSIVAYKRKGGELPGGCTDATACREYCSDFSNAEECLDFVKAVHKDDAPEEINKNIERLEKLVEFKNNGGTAPGGCTTRESCENYCSQSENRSECLAFREKLGLKVSPDAGARVSGPGGCNSADSCRVYCSEVEHNEECVDFAREHKVLTEEKITALQNQASRVKDVLSQAGAPVLECLSLELEPDVVNKLRQGLVPTQRSHEVMKRCLENVKAVEKDIDSSRVRELAPKIEACLREKLGGDVEVWRNTASDNPAEWEVYVSECKERLRLSEIRSLPPVESGEGIVLERLRQVDEKVIACAENFLGMKLLDGIAAGTLDQEKTNEALKRCQEKNTPSFPFYIGPSNGQGGSGQKIEGGLKEIIKKERNGVACVQVVTPATDPKTGRCMEFYTPCDVPAGWILGCRQGSETMKSGGGGQMEKVEIIESEKSESGDMEKVGDYDMDKSGGAMPKKPEIFSLPPKQIMPPSDMYERKADQMLAPQPQRTELNNQGGTLIESLRNFVTRLEK